MTKPKSSRGSKVPDINDKLVQALDHGRYRDEVLARIPYEDQEPVHQPSGVAPMPRQTIQGIPVTTAPFTPSKRVRPHTADLLNQGHGIVLAELMRLSKIAEVAGGDGLNPQQSKQLGIYVDSLGKLLRMEREEAKRDDPTEMNDAELLAAVEKAKRLLNG